MLARTGSSLTRPGSYATGIMGDPAQRAAHIKDAIDFFAAAAWDRYFFADIAGSFPHPHAPAVWSRHRHRGRRLSLADARRTVGIAFRGRRPAGWPG
jgi:hypothetical protein